MKILKDLKDRISGKVPAGKKRSSQWPAVRKKHLEKFPFCALCKGTKKLEVHHIKPFHLHPEFELDPDNLITLCENEKDGVNCHLLFGHLGSFKSFNESAKEDALMWGDRIKQRP